MIIYKILLRMEILDWRTHSKEILFSILQPMSEAFFFYLEGKWSKDLCICSILFSLLTWDSLRWVFFWVITLCFACVFFPGMSREKGIVAPQNLAGLTAPQTWCCKKQTEQKSNHQYSFSLPSVEEGKSSSFTFVMGL